MPVDQVATLASGVDSCTDRPLSTVMNLFGTGFDGPLFMQGLPYLLLDLFRMDWPKIFSFIPP
jgi:hypothetical protein